MKNLIWLLLLFSHFVYAQNTYENQQNHLSFTPLKSVNTTEKIIAFTFDDGPNSKISLPLAKIFQKNGGHATFFNIGKHLPGNEKIVKKLLKKGHEIGNHSMTHPHLPDYVNKDSIYHQIADFQQLYKKNFGYEVKLFRAPFLDYQKEDKDNRVPDVLKQFNLIPVNMSISARDWEANITVEKILERIGENPPNGSIILCHEMPLTVEAMKILIPKLKAKGYQFVTVSELLKMDK